DVDKDSVKYEVEPEKKRYSNATVTFAAKKGESFNINGLRDDLKKTRLGGKTRSGVNYLEITATGDVVAGEKEDVLKVSGTKDQFVLGDDPKVKPEAGKKTAYQRLEEALKKGEKIVSVTGRVAGWSGGWPKVLSELSKEPAKGERRTVLVVTDFEGAKAP